MIPILAPGEATSSTYIHFLSELQLRGFEGDLSTRYADRTVLATDNSIYQVTPQAILFPKNDTDVVRIARLSAETRFSGVVLTPRGGGTGTNGQSLTDSIAVDLSRHMNRILEVNPVEGWAWVEAGVVKDQLNDAIRQHGLFFAPELSPSNRATIGGMIATDASGQGSILYGKTRDHVLELKCVFLDGTPWHSVPLEPAALEEVKTRGDRIGDIHRLLDTISTEDQALIAERFPALNRCVTGYDLAHLRSDGGGFNLNAVLCGAEGTLAFVTAAKVNLSPIPRHSALVNIRYGSFDAALRDARVLMQAQAASSETVDATVLELARGDPIWLGVAAYFPEDPEGAAQGVNLVEFIAETESELDSKLQRVEALLQTNPDASGRRGYTVARDEATILAIWSMRKKSVGMLGNMPGEKRPVPFVEDTVVPPEHLADYIAEFRAALDRRGLVYGMFGHVDAGCVHVRPALDMKDPAQEKLIREISDEVYALTRKYKGVLWGEHGKGVRSEYAPDFFGPLYPRLQQVKAAFDPQNQLNPGKIAAPPGHSLMRIDAVPTRGQRDRLIPIALRAANQDSLHCNGNAACYNFDPDDAMCPSWKVTRERRHSPKGRASLMREWLQRLGATGVDAAQFSALADRRAGLRHLPRRAMNSWRRARQEDFSHAVKEAMDGCLACKSCSGQCPIKVDVPAFRSRFLALYHTRYLRPPRDFIVARLESALPWLSRIRAVSNMAMESPPVRAAMNGLGLVSLPAIDRIDVRRALHSRGVRQATPKALAELSQSEIGSSVVLVQDAFTSFYHAAVVVDFCELISRLGFTVWYAPFMPNGKPQHVLGFLDRFERMARASAKLLNQLAATGVDLVGVDPSMTLTYRSEYVKALGSEEAPTVALPQEWLIRHVDRFPDLKPGLGEDWQLLAHCTERTNLPTSSGQWRHLFERLGTRLHLPAVGCCGMAGLYGHQKEHREASAAIYGSSWAAKVSERRFAGRSMATGYSCRSQVKLIDGERLPHPVQVLLKLIKTTTQGAAVPHEAARAVERHEAF